MRHGQKHNHLGRKAAHRNAMLSNMASSLILHKRIQTTVAKARELRKYVEPLLTKAKTDSTHNRRLVFSELQDKEVLKELFDNVSEKIATRPGGYTRIIKLGTRLGDSANLCLIELVDYNELMLTEAKPAKARTRRSRRGAGADVTSALGPQASADEDLAVAESSAPAVEDAQLADEASAFVVEAPAEASSPEAQSFETAQDLVAEAPTAPAEEPLPEAPASDDQNPTNATNGEEKAEI